VIPADDGFQPLPRQYLRQLVLRFDVGSRGMHLLEQRCIGGGVLLALSIRSRSVVAVMISYLVMGNPPG
jgi:hypothetical protein